MSDRRATSLSPAEVFLLRAWAETAFRAFGSMPYLVGSVARAEPWRDVDVRCILDDGDALLDPPMRLAGLSAAVSFWAQRATGLPVDFQFQSRREANKYAGKRQPLAVLDVVYPSPESPKENR